MKLVLLILLQQQLMSNVDKCIKSNNHKQFTKMMNKITYLLFSLFLLSCSSPQEKRNKVDLINAVIECIDSKAFPAKILVVYESDFDYGDYKHYSILGFRDIYRGEMSPYEIMELKDKYVFFFSSRKKPLPEEYVDDIVEKYNNYDYFKGLYSNTKFYFLQCKKTGKSILHHAVNDDIYSFEIPELRDFSCSDRPFIKEPIELLVDAYSFNVLDKYVSGKMRIHSFPKNCIAVVVVYNRTDSCLSFHGADTTFGNWCIIHRNDTLRFHVKKISKTNLLVDDPTYKEDPEKVDRLYLTSDDNIDFFSRIASTAKNYHQNLHALVRDSLFYIPNVANYELNKEEGCIYPTKKIRTIVPIDIEYSYRTPEYEYSYQGRKLIYTHKP